MAGIKGSQTPRILAAQVTSKDLPLIGYDETAAAGQQFVRVSKSELEKAVNKPTFRNVTLLNSWRNFGNDYENLSLCKQGNQVTISGAIIGGASNTVAFNLPEGWRPATNDGFMVQRNIGGSVASGSATGTTVSARLVINGITGECSIVYEGTPAILTINQSFFTEKNFS